mmetsp:Transcript_3349/g.11101  ORF Transcript_3349/g.11101 Transcript_3349/m.11101 type:complete len:217 (-) Transcript_3349:235-885(-)
MDVRAGMSPRSAPSAGVWRMLVLLSCLSLCAGRVEVLDEDNYERVLSEPGVSAFVKFFAPECAHCRRMADDWRALEEEHADADSVVIGSVDCSSAKGEPLCERLRILGFPTLTYFTPATGPAGEEYEGERDYAALSALVAERVRPRCVVDTRAECSERELNYIARMREAACEGRRNEHDRLALLVSTSTNLKPAIRRWVSQRVHILAQLLQGCAGS